MATEGVPRRRSRPELGEKKECRRLGGLGSELEGALGSQGCDECYGVLNLAREGLSVVNLKARPSRRCRAEKGEARRPCSGVSRGVDEHAGGARPHHGGRAQPSSCVARRVAPLGAAALPRRQSTPPARHCSKLYPLSLGFCKNRPNFELKTKISPKQKLLRIL